MIFPVVANVTMLAFGVEGPRGQSQITAVRRAFSEVWIVVRGATAPSSMGVWLHLAAVLLASFCLPTTEFMR
jgi:hypothetical protein